MVSEWEQGTEKPSWGSGTPHEPGFKPLVCAVFPLDSLIRHNSKIKLLRISNCNHKLLNSNGWALCDCIGYWPLRLALLIPILMTAQDSYHKPPSLGTLPSPTAQAADELTCISRVSQQPSQLLPQLPSLPLKTLQAAQLHLFSHRSKNLRLILRQALSCHMGGSIDLFLPSLNISCLSVLFLLCHTAKGFTETGTYASLQIGRVCALFILILHLKLRSLKKLTQGYTDTKKQTTIWTQAPEPNNT